MKTNQDYKNAALSALKGNWAPAVLAVVVFCAVELVAIGPASWQMGRFQTMAADINPGNPAAMLEMMSGINQASSWQMLVYVFALFPLIIGLTNAFRALLVNGDNRVTQNMFQFGFHPYWHKVWGYLLMYIFIALLSLLLIIPGIVKSLSYAMTPYILEENPELSANEAIDRSRAMMRGHKYDLLWLYLSFIGWFLLSFLTLGIGLLWLIPYVETAQAAFYEDVKADYAQNGGLI